jgi:anti-sigma B factor antagonist
MSALPALTVSVQRGVRMSVVRLEGELDIAGDDHVRRMLGPLAAEGRAVVLDLSRLTFCDVPGMHALVEFAEAAAERGLRVEVRGARGEVARMLDLTSARDLLPLVG